MGARNFNGSVAGSRNCKLVMLRRTSVVSGTDNYTNQLHMRLRGRQMNLKVESDTTGVKWRLGAPRLML